MTRRQLVLFLLFAGASVTALAVLGGGFAGSGPKTTATNTHDVRTTSIRGEGLAIPGSPLLPHGGEHVFVEAPPEHLQWQDPQNPGYEVEVPYFIPWKLYADSIEPLPKSEEGGQVAVRCRNIVFRTYRTPESQVEAMALRRGEDDIVLHREFRADEALVFGRLAAKLRSDKRGEERVELGRDSELQLSKNLRIDDRAEGLVITGEQIRVQPKLGSASGTGPFEVRHAAFKITGENLELHRLDEDRTRVEIHENPVLELLENDTGSRMNPSALDGFEGEAFRNASVRAAGRAIVLRDVVGNDQRLRIEMNRDVRVDQEGGRSLDSDNLVVIAVNREDPDAPTEARSNGWRLRKLTADGRVRIKHIEMQEAGTDEIVKIATERLVHEVPESGVPTTLLSGSTRMSFEGRLPLGQVEDAPGIVYVSCTRPAWIGPLRESALPAGTTALGLRRLLLEGDARVEHTSRGDELVQDVLEGDEIELLFRVSEDAQDALGVAAEGKREEITALEFTARGNVRLSGTRLEGRANLLIARDLDGLNPHLSIIGPGTRVTFPDIGKGQRLLGPNETTNRASTGQGTAAAADPDAETWVLRRVDASGGVRVVTSLGGPSVGMPTQLTGARLSYDDLSGLAELTGTPARVEATALNGKPHVVTAKTLSVDRARSIVRARGGVSGELWAALDDVGPGSIQDLLQAEHPDAAAALEITTDERIDIQIVRVEDGGLKRDAEQLIRIFGPLTAELRSARMAVDSLQADVLSIGLMLRSKADAEPGPRRPSGPAVARTKLGTPTRPAPKPASLSRVEIEAGEIAIDMSGGSARAVDALAGVVIKSEMGRIIGERIQMRAETRTAHVVGTRARRAEAWFYDDYKFRNQVMARQFALRWDDTGAQEVRAIGTSDDPVMARLYQPGDAGKDGPRFERYEISSEGPIRVTPSRVDASLVWVSRALRDDETGTWSDPAWLFAPVLVVRGEQLLSSREAEKSEADLFRSRIRTVSARGDDTYFKYMNEGQPVQIWGDEFLLDVRKNEVRLGGSPVEYQQGDEVRSSWPNGLMIDLETGLPRMPGASIRISTAPKDR